jgi:hypothetical protein
MDSDFAPGPPIDLPTSERPFGAGSIDRPDFDVLSAVALPAAELDRLVHGSDRHEANE